MKFSPKQFRDALQESTKLSQRLEKYLLDTRKAKVYQFFNLAMSCMVWLKNFLRYSATNKPPYSKSIASSPYNSSFRHVNTQLLK